MPSLKMSLSIIFSKLYYRSEWKWWFMPLLDERNQIVQMGFEKSVKTLCLKADGCVRSLFFFFFFQNLYQSFIPVFCPFLVLSFLYIYSKIIPMELEALGCGRHFRTNFIIYINRSCLITKLCLFVTPWTVTHQAPLSMGFSRQGHWSGLPFPTLGDLVDPGIKPCVLHLKVNSYHWATREAQYF